MDPLTLTIAFIIYNELYSHHYHILKVLFNSFFICCLYFYIVHLFVVRSRSCWVIYYFDTPALGRRHQSFGRVRQCKTRFRFWNYAFETSVYLINRMPTPILAHRSPFDCLFQRSPDYHFLRTFGCFCFPFPRP